MVSRTPRIPAFTGFPHSWERRPALLGRVALGLRDNANSIENTTLRK